MFKISDSHIGEIINTFPFTQIYFDDFGVNNDNVPRMAYLNNKNQILMIDSVKKVLLMCNTNGSFDINFKLKHLLDSPVTICTNSKNEIFIGDSKKVVVFDSSITSLRKFNIRYKAPVDMTFDEDSQNLFIANRNIGMITVLNNLNGECNGEFSIEKPYSVRVNLKYLFVLTNEDNEINSKNKLMNGIFIFNKSNFSVVKIIKLEEWKDPKGLYLDRDCNILTTAFEIKENKISETRYFYIFDFNGNFIHKKGSDILSLVDLLIIDRKYLFIIDNKKYRDNRKSTINLDSESKNVYEVIKTNSAFNKE